MSSVPVAALCPLPARAGASGRERVALQRRHAALALAAAARHGGAELGPAEHDERGAPLAANGWHRSLSHARGLAAAALHRAPVGIDVERPRPLRADRSAAVLAPAEAQLVGELDELGFARAWSAKEAVLKKAGAGLLELSSCVLVAREERELWLVEHRGRLHEVWQRTVHGHAVAITFDGAPPATPPRWILLASSAGASRSELASEHAAPAKGA